MTVKQAKMNQMLVSPSNHMNMSEIHAHTKPEFIPNETVSCASVMVL